MEIVIYLSIMIQNTCRYLQYMVLYFREVICLFVNSDFEITVFKVVSANRLYNYISESTVRCKGRKRWAVALKSGGATYYTVDGVQILSDRFHPVILPKGSVYSWRCVEAGECLLIEFEADREDRHIHSFIFGV